MDKQIEAYIAQLDEQETLVLEIAKDHLGSSFDIERSIGFTSWLKEQSENMKITLLSDKII